MEVSLEEAAGVRNGQESQSTRVSAKRSDVRVRDVDGRNDFCEEFDGGRVASVFSVRVEDVWEPAEAANPVRGFLGFCIEHREVVFRRDESLESSKIRSEATDDSERKELLIESQSRRVPPR